MSDGPNLNDRFPIREGLSPPVVAKPIYECAEAVHVSGVVPHATVRVYAGTTELLAETAPPFAFADFTLSRRLSVGESITATQTVGSLTSDHSIEPVIVQPLDEGAIKNKKPDVGDDLYECGIVVPVGNLVPSTTLHVTEDGTEVGVAAVAETSKPVITSPLHAGAQVSAQAIACEGSGHEIASPWADPVPVKPAPVPTPAPGVHGPSLIVGNDTVTLTGLLVGAEMNVFDAGTLISSGWYATGGANWVPVSQPLTASSMITATQRLCGNVSPPSDPVPPTTKLRAPTVVGPICDGSRFVLVRDTVVNAIVVVFRNGTPVAYGGAAAGDVVLGLGTGFAFAAGDTVTAIQYMGSTVSPGSAPVTVVSKLAAPVVEVLGGEVFFAPKAGEMAIGGPVFPRGRGVGPLIRVQACCREEVRIEITGPDGAVIAQPPLVEVYPGYYSATWDWSSSSGWTVPDGIPVGSYAVTARSGCARRAARAGFYVIFDPAEVGGPPRFSFDATAVWFGTSKNALRGLHYYLHPSDSRVFSIAINAASGMTDAFQAAIKIARAEENLFAYSLKFHTKDVVDLLVNFTEAQCADDAACLTALLRAVGVPAHPVTADAALETGDANWTFDTWVEFLADDGGTTEWRIFHPHEYPGMAPESRATFGTTRGVATKAFNDLIVMAGEGWVAAQLDDGTSDVTYGRNSCSEPEQNISQAGWIDELCEQGYWPIPHWDCTGTSSSGLSGSSFRLDDGELRYGGRISGTVHLVNPGEDRRFGRVAVELIADRLESKAFGEETFGEIALRAAFDPGEGLAVPFAFSLPATLVPGRTLYLRARLDQRTAALHEVRLPETVAVELDLPDRWTEGEEGPIRAFIRNVGDERLENLRVELRTPFAFRFGRLPRTLGDLEPGEGRELLWRAHAVAPLDSGSVQLSVATANSGGAVAHRHVAIAAAPADVPARPAFAVETERR